MSQDMASRVRAGSSLEDAVSVHSNLVRPRDMLLVRTGELTGQLDHCLTYLAETLEKDDARAKQVAGLMILPVVVVHMMIPMMNLPALFGSGDRFTRFVFAVGKGYLQLYICVAGGWFLWRWLAGRTQLGGLIERLVHPLPLFGTAHKKSCASRFCRNLYFYLNAGIPILKAVPAAGEACGSVQIAEVTAARVGAMSTDSVSLASVLAGCAAFNAEMLAVLESGERSGDLDRTLWHVTQQAEADADRAMNRLALWGPKVLYLGLALVVVFRLIQYVWAYVNYLNEIMGM